MIFSAENRIGGDYTKEMLNFYLMTLSTLDLTPNSVQFLLETKFTFSTQPSNNSKSLKDSLLHGLTRQVVQPSVRYHFPKSQ
jgi:hypothetical protein